MTRNEAVISETALNIVFGSDRMARCAWAAKDLEYSRYHDEEWGTPQYDSTRLFEKICLEGFQSGLSWITVLRKRPAFREVFHGFDPILVAEMSDNDIERLLADDRIIRHRGKIAATITNARAVLKLGEPLNQLVWRYVDHARVSTPQSLAEIPTKTSLSMALSKELRARGFKFVGPTTMYALMQSCGMVNDHVIGCFRSGT